MIHAIKIIIAFFLMFVPLYFAIGSEPPELNPEKPIYQNIIPGVFGVGGVYRKVKLPEPKTVEQARLEAEIDKIKADTAAYKRKLKTEDEQRAHGHRWIRIGAALFVLGAFAFVALMKWGVEEGGAIISALGLGCVCYGAVIAKLAGKETIIAWGAVAFFVTAIAVWICKGTSIVDKLKKLRKKCDA